MEALADIKGLVPIASLFAGLVTAWVTVKLMLKQLQERVDNVEQGQAALWKQTDEDKVELTLLRSQFDVVSKMLRPEKVAEFNIGYATFKARTEEHRDQLLYRISQLEKHTCLETSKS